MKPKKSPELPQLFQSRLSQILNNKHPLYVAASQIDWESLDNRFGKFYTEERGAPGKATRLMVGLHYIKHAFNESDESVVARFVENPYWQYFCGFDYFQHEFPIHPTSLTKWRQRIGEDGVESLLEELLNAAQRSGHLNGTDLKRVCVDTTVQEKAIAYPTDARLLYKMREKLVRLAEDRNIKLRQSYRRVAKKALIQQSRYAHAKQYRRARRMTKKLKTYLGCVHRDIERKIPEVDEVLAHYLRLSSRLRAQKRTDSNKLYSIHEPHVECISKGKAHKRYEFGCKVGLVSTARDSWIIGVRAFHGNPYDGHTLKASLEQSIRLVNREADLVMVDQGYRGHNYEGRSTVTIVNFQSRKIKRMSYRMRKWLKRRSAIEPIISHAKHDNRMIRNYLKGELGDQVNPILAACGYNFRKLLKAFCRQKWQRIVNIYYTWLAVHSQFELHTA